MSDAARMDDTGWIVAIDASDGRREFAAADLPLTLGGETHADIALPVPGSIQLGRLGSVFFVQAGRNARNLRVDGELVAGSRELSDGAVVAFDRARLVCRIADGRLTATLGLTVTAGDTAPPALDELARGSGPAGAELAITPIAFQRAAAAARPGRSHRARAAALAVGAACVLLAALAWFAFTARSVAFHFVPEAEAMSLPQTVLKVRLGDRFLLRPGKHRVAAERAGYYPLDTTVDIGSDADQSIDLQFTKLPGLVSISTAPPAAATVLLDGMPLGTTPLTDAKIPPGPHKLEFDAERYLTQVLDLDVAGGGEQQSLVATLTPNWAPVSLATEPAGAAVFVDGAPAGTTPATLELTAGERELEVRLDGYNAWRGKLTVNANQPQQLPDVKLAQADGKLEVVTAPDGANVTLDGQYHGRTPLSLRLSPGRKHELALAKPGFETVVRDVSVTADSGRRLSIDLTPQLGDIDVRSTPAAAEVWVDGERRGSTPSRLSLPAVDHDIELKRSGFAVAHLKVTPRPGFPQVLESDLVALDDSTGSGYKTLLKTSLGEELKLIPAGQFTMGSSRREVGRRSNEVLRPVRLTHAFYLSRREVTNAEFRAFRPAHDSGQFASHSLNGDAQPVVRVSWDDAAQFLNWLSIKDGLQPVYEERAEGWFAVRPLRNGYRLPTEAEWEWAARFAGQENALLYPWGAALPPPDRSGNFADVAARDILPTTLVTYDDGYAVTAPTGSFAANALGIFDLGGNVAEWVQDIYTVDTLESSELADDPLGPDTGRFHLVRGASWRSATVTELRVAYRNYGAEGSDDVGFRIARNLQ